nr:hypothetical protein GCM10020092_050310 [Actinoplanes digitatis]
MIPLPVTRHQGRYARRTEPERPAPAHSPQAAAAGEVIELPLPDQDVT